LTRIDGQYLGFQHDLQPSLVAGEHVLSVRLDNRYHPNVLPGARAPDFILHGGLAGRVFIERVPALNVETDSIEVVSGPAGGAGESLSLRCVLSNRSTEAHQGEILWTITDADGAQVASAAGVPFDTRPGARSLPLEAVVRLPEVHCWAPEHPHLYWAEGHVFTNDGTIDAVRIRFGITRAEFRPRLGFFLDGQRIDLHGCNRHEAVPGFGNALPPDLQRRDARMLKSLGCNFVRLSHYPQSRIFLDACDELGIMVYEEIATWKSVRSDRGWRRAARRQMRDLILRDRHHPSVILWGMGNESRSRKAYLELRGIARELDPGRPVTYAENHLYRARRKRTISIPDVWGVNYELDALDEARSSSRLENVVLSECCNHPTSVKGNDAEELTQVATIEQEWEMMADRPYLAGHAVWSFTDYATEHRLRFRRLTGLLDAWRRPKMAAELFRARYGSEPFIALFITPPGPEAPPSRFRRVLVPESSSEGDRELHVFTNCESVRLQRDGENLAVLEGAIHFVVALDRDFEEISAEGTRHGTKRRRSIHRHRQAARVAVAIAEEAAEPGRTLAVDLTIRDAAGAVVRDWNGHVRLEIVGSARLHAYTADNEALIARGEGRAYLTTSTPEGEVLVAVTADGLEPGSATVRVTPSDRSAPGDR